MKRSAIISMITIVLLAGGYYYLAHYTELLSKTNEYYGYYEGVNGLQPSAPVYVKGVKAGKVEDIIINGDNRIRVTSG